MLAHARRKFYEVQQATDSPIAAEVLRRIAELYAIRYSLTRCSDLSRVLDDGHIELDTNTVERAIRAHHTRPQNHLFAGSDRGAARWAAVCFLITTAKLDDIEPFAYLKMYLFACPTVIR